jgi:hypothetical protein
MDGSSHAVRERGFKPTPYPRFPPLTSAARESLRSLNHGLTAGRRVARVVDAGAEKITLPAAVFPTSGASPVARRWWRPLSDLAPKRAWSPAPGATLSSQAAAFQMRRFRALKLGRPKTPTGLSRQGSVGVGHGVRRPLIVSVGPGPWPSGALRPSHVQEER